MGEEGDDDAGLDAPLLLIIAVEARSAAAASSTRFPNPFILLCHTALTPALPRIASPAAICYFCGMEEGYYPFAPHSSLYLAKPSTHWWPPDLAAVEGRSEDVIERSQQLPDRIATTEAEHRRRE